MGEETKRKRVRVKLNQEANLCIVYFISNVNTVDSNYSKGMVIPCGFGCIHKELFSLGLLLIL